MPHSFEALGKSPVIELLKAMDIDVHELKDAAEMNLAAAERRALESELEALAAKRMALKPRDKAGREALDKRERELCQALGLPEPVALERRRPSRSTQRRPASWRRMWRRSCRPDWAERRRPRRRRRLLRRRRRAPRRKRPRARRARSNPESPTRPHLMHAAVDMAARERIASEVLGGGPRWRCDGVPLQGAAQPGQRQARPAGVPGGAGREAADLPLLPQQLRGGLAAAEPGAAPSDLVRGARPGSGPGLELGLGCGGGAAR